jgi:hypothetical protein
MEQGAGNRRILYIGAIVVEALVIAALWLIARHFT